MISSNDKSLSVDPSALEFALGAQHLVLVVYYPDYLKKVCAITAYLANLSKISSVVVVINNLAITENALSGLFCGSLASVKVIRHDNIGFEFGAYQRGIDEIRKSEDQPFDVIVMNDTVGTHQRIDQLYLRNFRDTVRTRPVRSIVGNTDSVPRRLDVNGLYCVRWVRSNLFYIDHAALASINHTIYVPGIDDLILGGPTEAEFYSQDVSPSLKHHISSWLFGKGALAWYKAQPLSAENCTQMAFKARCILQELYLSMRLEAADTHFLPPIPLRFYEKAAVRLGYANL
jgi:hypothetical protein